MLTEYQEQFYREMGMCIKRHMMENDLTSMEIIGIMDVMKTEVMEDVMLGCCDCEGCDVEDYEDYDDGEEDAF